MATRRTPPRQRSSSSNGNADAGAPIRFVVHGSAAPATRGTAAAPLPAGLLRGQVRHSVSLDAPGAATRSTGAREQTLQAEPGRDVVVLRIADGPALVLHPEHARDLLRAQQGAAPRTRSQTRDGEAVAVPQTLRWQGLDAPAPEGSAARDGGTRGGATRHGNTRGLLGRVLLAGLDIVRDPGGDALPELAADLVAARVDAQVTAGVYALDAQALTPLKGSGRAPLAQLPPADGPLLVFIHGTFSNSASAFSKLWSQHPQRVAALFEHYAGRVYALDHPTLTASPVANALLLAQALPPGARVHLVTHSRGGLVAEVLARAAANPEMKGEDTARFTAAERRDLAALAQLLADKQVRVERVVRVACPSRGTLLASKRLDAYLSVFKWTLELAAVPVLPELVQFLSAVAQRRADAEELPGLAAQIPGSALIEWLHAADAPLPGQLRVIAGDVQGDSVGSWLKTLLADGFYWTDNDLIVQTRSMYGGAPRQGGALFLLDRGGRVSHNSYFAAERSAEAVCNALTQQQPAGFATIGPLSAAGEHASGSRGGPTRAADSGDKPAVILLPGICGSNLAVDGKRIWLGFRIVNGLKRLAYPDADGSRITADGAIGPVYDDLAAHLAQTHHVIEFAYDWRRPLEEEARRLAQVTEAALAARQTSGQPVRFIAHSMGGLVVRTMQLEAPQVFERAMAHAGARLLMLGTPNGGSWAPMQVLSGDDSFGNTLVAFGAPFQDASARALMARMPGFLQLQAALTDDALGLAQAATWQALAAKDIATVRERNWWHNDETQLAAYEWGVPTQAVLDQARALRVRLDAQRADVLPHFAAKLRLVVGRAEFTPDGYEIGAQGLDYLDARDDGDGRVTRASARLPGVRTWQVDCAHGKLPDHAEAFASYVELLADGSTAGLTALPDVATAPSRGTRAGPAAAHRRSRPSRAAQAFEAVAGDGGDRGDSGDGAAAAATAAPRDAPRAAARGPRAAHALAVEVINGNLKYVPQPMMVGHYRASSLTGTEWVVDSLIGGAMRTALDAGLYPNAPGTQQVFRNLAAPVDNPLQMPRPEAVIVVGLGDEGELRPGDLTHAVRQAVIAWAQRVYETRAQRKTLPASGRDPDHGAGPNGNGNGNGNGSDNSNDSDDDGFELAAALIGSGGSGIGPGQAAQLIAKGARDAMLRLQGSRWPPLRKLHLVELYLDRGSDAWRALQVLATAMPGHYDICKTIRAGQGALRRGLDAGYRGADYDLLSAVHNERRGWDARIEYTIDTKRARSEVRAQATQSRLLHELIKRASNEAVADRQIGHTLHQLLIPPEMDPFFGGSTEMRLELDERTACIPWELLDTASRGGDDTKPWAVRSKLLRKLRTVEFRNEVVGAGREARLLVIGEPECDEKRYGALPAARAEAAAVRDLLAAKLGDERVQALIRGEHRVDAQSVVNKLLEQDWRVVHIAGHGEPPEFFGADPPRAGEALRAGGDPRGVVLSDATFLGSREIQNMRCVPDLVFVNCCHLARGVATLDPGDDLTGGRGFDRARFAATVAESLIRIGVRCVVAAGWAVADEAAKVFAQRFYEALLADMRFIDAVAEARAAAFKEGGNTWAAYQCYGDPDWTLQRGSDTQAPAKTPEEEFSGVASPLALALALETIAVTSREGMGRDVAAEAGRLKKQQVRIRYLEKEFGHRWSGMGAVAEAFGVAWAACGHDDEALEWFSKAVRCNDASASIKAQEQAASLTARQACKAALAAPPRSKAFAQARMELARTVEALRTLADWQPTPERNSLVGSALKKLSIVHERAGDDGAAHAARLAARQAYRSAECTTAGDGAAREAYPGLNRMALELVEALKSESPTQFDHDSTLALRCGLRDKNRDDADFWSIVGLVEIDLYEAIAASALAPRLAAVAAAYDDLYQRVSSPQLWSSVSSHTAFVLDAYGDAASTAAAETQAVRALKQRLRGFTAQEGAP